MVPCDENGKPLEEINDADWQESEEETPEERKARLERERQEKVQKLMSMMKDHEQGAAGGGKDKDSSTEGESDSG